MCAGIAFICILADVAVATKAVARFAGKCYHRSMKARVLKLKNHDEEREIAFELAFLAGLTVEERVDLVLERSRMLHEMLARNGHTVTPGVVKRA